jgi:hypothetical protein
VSAADGFAGAGAAAGGAAGQAAFCAALAGLAWAMGPRFVASPRG